MPLSLARLTRRWQYQTAAGPLEYIAAVGDDYIELRAPATEPGLPADVELLDGHVVGPLSFRAFGHGLGILRLLATDDPLRRAPPSDRLGSLVAELTDTVWPRAAWVDENLVIQTVRLPLMAAPEDVEEVASVKAPGIEEDQPLPHDEQQPVEEPLPEWLDQASAAVERGQFGHAARWAASAPTEDVPESREFLQVLALVRRGERQTRRWPRDVRERLGLAWAYLATGAYRAAVREATEVLRLDPNRGCAHALLGMVRLAHGDLPAAEAAYATAQALALPDDPHVHALAAALAGEPLRPAALPAEG